MQFVSCRAVDHKPVVLDMHLSVPLPNAPQRMVAIARVNRFWSISDCNSARSLLRSLPRNLALLTSRLNCEERTGVSMSDVEVAEQFFGAAETLALPLV